MADVFANNRSILHQGDGQTHVSGPPDVCKTPAPGGPIPVPYPNIARDSDLAKGTKKVKINGKPVATEASNLSTSTGDEAGTAGGGIVSSKTKGKLTWGSASTDVLAEGKGVARFMDVTQHNGNVWNTVLLAAGDPAAFGYGDDPIDRQDCAVCRKPKSQHRLEADANVMILAGEIATRMQNGAFAAAYRDPKNKPLGKGVMLGVLSCRCGTHGYAGISGSFNNPLHANAATAFQNTVSNLPGNLFQPPLIAPLTAIVAPPSPPPLTGQYPVRPRRPPPFEPVRQAQWDQRMRVVDAVRARVDSPTALVCAAPKIVQRCLSDGHKPNKMIEIWVRMKPHKTVPIPRYQRIVPVPGSNPPVTRTEWSDAPDSTAPRDFADGDAVPSCATCQVLMTIMLCKLHQPPCP